MTRQTQKMKKLIILMLATGSLFFACTNTFAVTIPNTNNKSTFLGPTARLKYTSSLGTDSAYSLYGDAGGRNFRLSGTVGWNIGLTQRFKVTGEYLWQHINYSFFSNENEFWAQQGDAGVAYQYDIAGAAFNPQIDVNAYVTHSPSKNFGANIGTFTNALNVIQPFNDNERATGSNAIGISPGLTVTPWNSGSVTLAVNYDKVGYDRSFQRKNDVNGFGGTISLNQTMNDMFNVNLLAAVRAPFNEYAASVSWSIGPVIQQWTLSLFGEYVDGAHALPDTYNAGLSAAYSLDTRTNTTTANAKGEVPVTTPVNDHLMAWTASPAVYMPEVLSIADEEVTP